MWIAPYKDGDIIKHGSDAFNVGVKYVDNPYNYLDGLNALVKETLWSVGWVDAERENDGN